MNRKTVRNLTLVLLGLITVVAAMAMASCSADGSALPVSQWFAAGPDGSTPYDETTEPIKDIAGLFGPVGDAVALSIAGLGILGTGVTGIASRRKSLKVQKIGPVAHKLIYNISQIREDNPDLWEQMKVEIADGMNADDKSVIDHFRPDKKGTNIKILRGTES